MWAAVGLGNPGKKYARTRHNAGYVFIKKVAKENGTRLRKRKYLSRTATCEIMRQSVLLATPQTYMNRSGEAVKEIMDNCGLPLDRLILVYDDMDIPLGEIRIRVKGSAGTHKGVASVIHQLQSNMFPRIRIGVGPLNKDLDATEFVLSSFNQEEESSLEKGLDMAREAFNMILTGQIDIAMNKYNQRIRQDQADQV